MNWYLDLMAIMRQTCSSKQISVCLVFPPHIFCQKRKNAPKPINGNGWRWQTAETSSHKVQLNHLHHHSNDIYDHKLHLWPSFHYQRVRKKMLKRLRGQTFSLAKHFVDRQTHTHTRTFIIIPLNIIMMMIVIIIAIIIWRSRSMLMPQLTKHWINQKKKGKIFPHPLTTSDNIN